LKCFKWRGITISNQNNCKIDKIKFDIKHANKVITTNIQKYLFEAHEKIEQQNVKKLMWSHIYENHNSKASK